MGILTGKTDLGGLTTGAGMVMTNGPGMVMTYGPGMVMTNGPGMVMTTSSSMLTTNSVRTTKGDRCICSPIGM